MYGWGGSYGGLDGAICKQEVGIGWPPKMERSVGGGGSTGIQKVR